MQSAKHYSPEHLNIVLDISVSIGDTSNEMSSYITHLSLQINKNVIGKFSRWQTDDIVIIFLRKQVVFQANCWDNLHEMSNPVFWQKEEKYFKILSAENFTQHAKCYNLGQGIFTYHYSKKHNSCLE